MKTFKTERPVNSAAISPIKPHVRIMHTCMFFYTFTLETVFFTLCILLLRVAAHLTHELHCNHAAFVQGAGQGCCDVLNLLPHITVYFGLPLPQRTTALTCRVATNQTTFHMLFCIPFHLFSIFGERGIKTLIRS